jgi:hypothetical protein
MSNTALGLPDDRRQRHRMTDPGKVHAPVHPRRKVRRVEVRRDLSDTQSKLLNVTPRLHNARMALGRMETRSPYACRCHVARTASSFVALGLSKVSAGGFCAFFPGD